jgi:16S rRNA (cytosine1402-N4)-methyltransferase
MKKEVLELLITNPKGLYVDCTVGTGGHTEEILKAKANQNVSIIGMDRDGLALDIARKRLKVYGERVRLIQGNFGDMEKHLAGRKYDGFLLDLGISSLQLADSSRGFSYMKDAPIDMAMGEDGHSVRKMLAGATKEEISRILKEYGEERRHRMIAKSIVRMRDSEEIVRTGQLVEAVKEVIYPNRVYGALSRVFQAFRIWANEELDNLRLFLPQALELLNTRGRIAIISYHSLEDRIVKRFFVQEEKDCICPPSFPVCVCDKQAALRIITRKPVLPSQLEIEKNTRARSAKLRVAERIRNEQ